MKSNQCCEILTSVKSRSCRALSCNIISSIRCLLHKPTAASPFRLLPKSTLTSVHLFFSMKVDPELDFYLRSARVRVEFGAPPVDEVSNTCAMIRALQHVSVDIKL